MKKKNVFIVLLLLVLVLSVNWYSNTRKDGGGSGGGTLVLPEKKKLSFGVPQGTYAKEKFGKQYTVYWFDKPNDNITVYRTQENRYVIGENTGKAEGKCYAECQQDQDAMFLALSNNYLLFETTKEQIVVSLEGEEKSFEELSKREQASFVFYSTYDEITVE